jgi:serine/threonine protein kinase
MTTAFNFEREILFRCRDEHLSRIIRTLEDGKVIVDTGSPVGVVQYLIFELANSDIRVHAVAGAMITDAWRLRTLHDIATGLYQLHRIEIAHQDVKPSNVLVIGDGRQKLSDLGCAAHSGTSAPRDGHVIAGDRNYAPPELLYGYTLADWHERRLGCDLYLLGSMISFLFSQASMTHVWVSQLDPIFRPGRWTDTFQAVLPYLRSACDNAFVSISKSFPETLATELSASLRQLCDPDPMLRGHPRSRSQVGNRYSLERYVSTFNLLAKRAELRVTRLLM